MSGLLDRLGRSQPGNTQVGVSALLAVLPSSCSNSVMIQIISFHHMMEWYESISRLRQRERVGRCGEDRVIPHRGRLGVAAVNPMAGSPIRGQVRLYLLGARLADLE